MTCLSVFLDTYCKVGYTQGDNFPYLKANENRKLTCLVLNISY